jgi:hypothetical protein
MAGEDYFADVRGSKEVRGHGVLDGDAIHEQNSASVTMSKDNTGMDYSCSCQDCGRPHHIQVTWLEFLYGSMRRIPFDPYSKRPWVYEQTYGGFHPNVGCTGCGRAIMLIITPDECERHIKSGLAAGVITPDQVNQVRSQLAAQANAYKR